MKTRHLAGLSNHQITIKSEFSWRVAVDLKAHADFNKCWGCPSHHQISDYERSGHAEARSVQGRPTGVCLQYEFVIIAGEAP
jgi:hypothetical protein